MAEQADATVAGPACPLCGNVDKENSFDCPSCGKEGCCGNCYDTDYLTCKECADKERRKAKQKQVKQKKTTKIQAAPEAADTAPAEDKTPFHIKKISCPICETVSNQRQFKSKLYSEKKVDLDKHCLQFGWADPDFKQYHPPLYYFWHCPNCKFTESFMEFENPGKPIWSNFRDMKNRYPSLLSEDTKAQKLVNWLGKNVDYDQITYLMSIRVHLLAIYIQEIMDTRTESGEDADEDTEEKDAGEDLRDVLKLGRFYLRTGWLFKELREDDAMKEDHATALNILKELKKVWPDVPDSEKAMFGHAAQHMTKAYESHPAIKNVAAAVDMLLWIGGIHLSTGNEKKGLETLNNVLATAQKSKTKIEQRMKNPNLSAEEDRQLNKWVVSVDRSLTKARELMADIQYEKNRAIKAKAKKLIAKMDGQEPEIIRAKLAKAGIKLSIINALVPEKKKKKLFGLF